MKPKYAQPTRAPVGAVSARRQFVRASTPAFDAEYGPISGVWLAAASEAMQQVALAGHDLVDDRAVRAPHAHEVDLQRALDLLDRRGRQAADEADARVGDRDVDRAKARHGAADRALQRVEVGHVGLERRRAIAERRSQLLEQLRLEAHQRDVRPRRVQPPGARRADPARRARDEDRAPRDVQARPREPHVDTGAPTRSS